MNCCSRQFPRRSSPAVSGSSRRRWELPVTNLKQLVLTVLFAFIALTGLKAAETGVATATTSTNRFNVVDDNYRLSVGDQLSFQIIEDEEDPKGLTVMDSGDLQVPYIGRYPAVGKTCKELAGALKVELEKDYYRQATVIIAVDAKPRSRGKIYIVGAIRTPGPQEIASDETLTVSRAILRAGSFSDFADQKNVQVTRGSGVGADVKKMFTVNVAQIFEKGKTENDLVLQPGDLIFIPERMIRF
jgi:protein involved in polysaccharide export with SLBB domain